jgi:hypothetical protein
MGIFSSIKNAVLGKPEAEGDGSPISDMVRKAADVARSSIDIEAVLDAMPGADALNWRTSIVDLMKLVGIDSSYANRKELAVEMGNADYAGSAEDNILLHKQVMQALADNGGNVPDSLL